MEILFASSEIYPYTKTGGLADVAHSLPEALSGYVTVHSVMPLYRFIDREAYGIVPSGLTFEYWLHGTRHVFDVFRLLSNPRMLFIYNPIICDRDTPYSTGPAAYTDDGFRFTLFGYGVLETMIRMALPITTIHLNDWQTAPIALLAKNRYRLPQKIILTIHNFAYQGISDKNIMTWLELSWEDNFKPEILESFNSVNLLKGGIHYADAVTTVSPSYAGEIKTAGHGAGLEETLRRHAHKIRGILNGISYEIFDPAKDPYLYRNYDRDSLGKKGENKKALLEELGFAYDEKPLFVFIGRFTAQKGIDLLVEALPLFNDLEANMVILGSGEESYNQLFRSIATKYRNIYMRIGYDETLAQRLYAGADFLLMPSVFEPCGLNQMIALKYGTMPIVSRVGGLRDSIADLAECADGTYPEDRGVGITFEKHDIFWFMHAITRALAIYAHRKKRAEIAAHNMAVDFSWRHSAQSYLELYR